MNVLPLLNLQTIPTIYYLFGFSLILLITDAFTKKESKLNIFLSIIFFCFASGHSLFGIVQGCGVTNANLLNFEKGMLQYNSVASCFDIIFCTTAILTILYSREYMKRVYEDHKEYYSLIMFSVFAMSTIAHSNNLIVLFLGIETMSVSFYALTGFIRTRERAVEGALKYFLLGAFASGFLVYGMAMIYGGTGSMEYRGISEAIFDMGYNAVGISLYLKLGIGLLLVGMLFKVAAFPFHQWAPDVYQAAPTPISGFMSVAGKVAALAGMLGVLTVLMPHEAAEIKNNIIIDNNRSIQIVIAVVAAATMLLGNITAIRQTNVKRMLAYSSVGHAGYLLMGVVADTNDGTFSILYYSVAYLFTQIGAFMVLAILEDKDESSQELTAFAGLSKKEPILAALMSIFMFSLAGIPPFAGFFGKYFIFKAAIDAGFTWLTLIAVVTSIISVYFYLSVSVQMYFKGGNDDTNVIHSKNSSVSRFTLWLVTAGVLLLGFVPIYDWIVKF